MPIQLSSAFSVGDYEASDYTHIRVSSFVVSIKNGTINFEVQYGYYDDGAWVWGKRQPPVERQFQIKDTPANETNPDEITPEDPAYTTIIGASVPNTIDEKLYDGIGRTLYQWLLDNHSDKFAGTIV